MSKYKGTLLLPFTELTELGDKNIFINRSKLVSQDTTKTMNSKDLRLGNFVLFAEDSTVFQVEGIDSLGLEVKNEIEETWIEIDSFQGIDIDENWLLGFGFRKTSKTDFVQSYENVKHPIVGYRIPKVENYHSSGFVYCGFGIEEINSVHQLQNIYFSLIGEELELSPVKTA